MEAPSAHPCAFHLQTSLGGLDIIVLDHARDVRACETTEGGRFSYVLTSADQQRTFQSPRRLYFSLSGSLFVIADRPELHAIVRNAIDGSPLLC